MLGQIIYSAVHRGTLFTIDSQTYALLNGQSLSRSSYASLSTLWPSGAYASTDLSIHLPDADSLYVRGLDLGRGADTSVSSRTALSGTLPSGSTIGSFQSAQVVSHVHVSGTQVNNTANSGGPGGSSPAAVNTTNGILFSSETSQFTVVSGTTIADWDVANYRVYPYICVSDG